LGQNILNYFSFQSFDIEGTNFSGIIGALFFKTRNYPGYGNTIWFERPISSDLC